MDDNQINEMNLSIATNLFGLVEGKDFGEFPEHDWRRDSNGEIDMHAWDSEYHNGPVCNRCYHSPCIWCYGEEGMKGPCVVHSPTYHNSPLKLISRLLADGELYMHLDNKVHKVKYQVRDNSPILAESTDFSEVIFIIAYKYSLKISECGSGW